MQLLVYGILRIIHLFSLGQKSAGYSMVETNTSPLSFLRLEMSRFSYKKHSCTNTRNIGVSTKCTPHLGVGYKKNMIRSG